MAVGSRWHVATSGYRIRLDRDFGVCPRALLLCSVFTAGAVFANLTSVWVMWDYRQRITSGTFSSYLLTPVHPFHRDLCAMLASKVVGLPIVLTGAVLTGAAMGASLPPSISGALLGLVVLALAVALRFVVEWVLALAAFWMVRTDGLNSLYFAVASLRAAGPVARMDACGERIYPFSLLLRVPSGDIYCADYIKGWTACYHGPTRYDLDLRGARPSDL